MRIAFITSINPYSQKGIGGAETSIRLMADSFSRLFHNCILLYETTIGIPSKKTKNIVSFNASSISFLQRSQPLFRATSLFIKVTRAVFILLKFKPHIVYCYYENLPCIICLFYKFLCPEVKIVCRIAGYKWRENCRINRAYILFYRYIFNNFDSLNFISSDLSVKTHSIFKASCYNIHPRKSFILDIGVPESLFDLNWNPDSKEFRIIMVARFSDYQKRQDILLKAFCRISHLPGISLTFIGEGTNLDYIKSLPEARALDNLFFINQQPSSILLDTMIHSSLLCLCTSYEGLSKVVVESMASGLPVLASNVSPLNTYILDSINGFLVANTIDQWEIKLRFLYFNRNILSIVSENARHFALDNYNARHQALKYIDVFANI